MVVNMDECAESGGCLIFYNLVSEVIWQCLHDTLLIEMPQIPLGFKGREHCPHLSMRIRQEFMAICFKTITPTRQEIQAVMMCVLYTTVSSAPCTVAGM